MLIHGRVVLYTIIIRLITMAITIVYLDLDVKGFPSWILSTYTPSLQRGNWNGNFCIQISSTILIVGTITSLFYMWEPVSCEIGFEGRLHTLLEKSVHQQIVQTPLGPPNSESPKERARLSKGHTKGKGVIEYQKPINFVQILACT